MIGFRRLGYEPYYVEAHAVFPRMLMQDEQGDGTAQAAAFLQRVLAASTSAATGRIMPCTTTVAASA